MKNVLLISYYFPPCTLTAGQRPFSWCMHLHKMGYRPIVITRKWEKEIKVFSDVNQISSPGILHEVHEWGEVYYLPYEGNMRDRLMAKYGNARFSFWRKLLTFGELVFENFSLSAIPYRNFYKHAAALLKTHDIAGAIISSGPFPQFSFGYKLHKTFGLPWIADYRDDWSTDEVNTNRGRLFRFLKRLNRVSEKKWLASASAFTTISPHYLHKIAALAPTPGYVVQNGFSEIPSSPSTEGRFSLVYNGTLYPTQPVEELLHGLRAYNQTSTQKLSVDFPGLAVDGLQKARVEELGAALEILPFLYITARIPKNEVMEKQASALALVMFGHRGLKGIPSSKIYEYLGLGKPIILFEPDGDILEEIVAGYNLGFIVGKPHSFSEIITRIQHMEQQNAPVPDWEYIGRFSRESQVATLARIMDQHFLS